jgi:hypothetical protein
VPPESGRGDRNAVDREQSFASEISPPKAVAQRLNSAAQLDVRWIESLKRIWHLVGQWRSNVRKVLPARRTKRSVIGASFGKTQIAIRPTEHFICVSVVLPIVLPEAHGADFVRTAFAECLEATAWASESKVAYGSHPVVHEGSLLAVAAPAPLHLQNKIGSDAEPQVDCSEAYVGERQLRAESGERLSAAGVEACTPFEDGWSRTFTVPRRRRRYRSRWACPELALAARPRLAECSLVARGR